VKHEITVDIDSPERTFTQRVRDADQARAVLAIVQNAVTVAMADAVLHPGDEQLIAVRVVARVDG
jgi:hypothetical protein